MKVFDDLDALCDHAIMAMHPEGCCERAYRPEDPHPGSHLWPVVTPRTTIEALGGTVELFFHHYSDYSDDSQTFYLALRGTNGTVLLARVAQWDSDLDELPEIVRFSGDETNVVVETVQDWWNEDHTRVVRKRETTRCTLDDQGTISCGGECPRLAPDVQPPKLDCAALEAFDWSTLSRGERTESSGMLYDSITFDRAQDFLGVAGDEYEDHEHMDVHELDGGLRVTYPAPHRWVLSFGQIPLLSSWKPIRVGRAPGGLFVSSRSRGVDRIHRLRVETLELEPVFPGVCGGEE
jgi:hypothetical protein